MAKIESKNKQNPKLQQSELKDGRASLYLEFYLGRSETPVLDEDGNQLLYTSGAMAGKPKYRIKHIRKRENLNLYVWLYPRNQQERLQNRNTLALAEKIRFEREQEFLENREGYQREKHINGNKKKGRISLSARYLPGIPKGAVRSRWSVDVIIVTKVIAMAKVNERKRSSRICFGIPFSPKSHCRNRSHCRDRSLFFSLP